MRVRCGNEWKYLIAAVFCKIESISLYMVLTVEMNRMIETY